MVILRVFSNPSDSVILQLWSLPSLSTPPLAQRVGLGARTAAHACVQGHPPPYTELLHSHILPAHGYSESLGPATLCNIKTPFGTRIYHSWLLLKSVTAGRGVGGGLGVVGWGRRSARPWRGSAALVKPSTLALGAAENLLG